MFDFFDFSYSYRAMKDLEKSRKEENIGKRNFKQIEKVHRKNKRKRGKHGHGH